MNRKIVVSFLAGSFFLCGCAHTPDDRILTDHAPPAADKVYTPTAAVVPRPSAPAPDIPEDLKAPGTKWRLVDIIDVALRNSPSTKAAWHTARGAAADFLSQRGSTYFPDISASATGKRVDVITEEKRTNDNSTSLSPAVELTYLLFDFGGRKASLEEKERALYSADFLHTAAVQDQVLLVIQSYYTYAAVKALEEALTTSLSEAATNLKAADEKHQQGLATIADVLQAKTAYSQAKLNLETAQGKVHTIRGSLATSMGIPVGSSVDIDPLPENPPVDQVTETVEEHLRQAQITHPNLAAQRQRVEESMAHTRTVRSARFPTLSFTNTIAGLTEREDGTFRGDNTAALILSVPLWDHGAKRYDLLKAEEDAKAQAATLESLEQSVALAVWTNYYDLKTATQQIRTTQDLLAGATQSQEVALGRYKEGVGGFLDLLAAQSALTSARAQYLSAQADWYIAFSDLARNTGALWSDDPAKNTQLIDTFQPAAAKEHP